MRNRTPRGGEFVAESVEPTSEPPQINEEQMERLKEAVDIVYARRANMTDEERSREDSFASELHAVVKASDGSPEGIQRIANFISGVAIE